MLVSIIQRQMALSAAQKAQLQALSAKAAGNFQRMDDIEWTVAREGLEVRVAVRIIARSGVFRARGAGSTFARAAHDALERALKQRRQSKRARVDRRDDLSTKGSGGRRRPRSG